MDSAKMRMSKFFTDCTFLFITGAGIGWLYEVIIHIFKDGAFVNRGMLHGPWLPIYGVGCLIMVGLKLWIGEHPISYFAASVAACGVIEYAASWMMETFYGMRWWDYSSCPLNLNGRIFAGGLIGFGAAGCLFVFVLLPILQKIYGKIPERLKKLIALVFIIIFIIDAVSSVISPNIGLGITNY